MRRKNYQSTRSWAGRPSHGSRASRRYPPAGRGERKRGVGASFSIIFALYLIVSAGMATATAGMLHGRSHLRTVADPPSRIVIHPPKYLVLIVLDGARPDYFGLTRLPHVDALRARGTQFTNAMDGILEAETPSGHTTLATGSTPAHNGILGFDWQVNDNDFSLFSPTTVRAGRIEHIMEATGTPTIAGLYKKRFPTARVVALSGHKYYAADPLGGPDADAIMYYQGGPHGQYMPVSIPGHAPPAGVLDAPGLTTHTTHLPLGAEDRLATKLAVSAFHVMHQRITLINYPEFDWPLGHVYGGSASPTKVIALMKEFDHDLGMIENAYRKAGILNQTMFAVTADHGMTVIHRNVPDSIITNAVAQAGTTAPVITSNTGSYIWLTDETRAQTVAAGVAQARDPGIESVYYLSRATTKPQYLPAPGLTISSSLDAANRYLLKTLMNGHEPDVVVFCREGQTTSSPTIGWKGDHGGASWQSQNIPLILAGPGIRSGAVVKDAAQLDDIAPTVLTVMGVKPTGMQGRVLTDALIQPRKAARKARSGEIKGLTPVVRALVAQDRADR